MDPFRFASDNNDTTELAVPKMKRSFNAMMNAAEPIYLRNIKQNLLADFDQTPTKVMKGVSAISPTVMSEPEVTVEQLRRELCEKEADIITLRASIVQWEKKVAKLETQVNESQISHDKHLAKMIAARDRESAKASELHNKLQYLMGKEKLARDETDELRQEWERQKVEMDRKMLLIQREKLESEDKNQQLRSDWLAAEAKLREESFSHKLQINNLTSSLEEAKAQLLLKEGLEKEKTSLTNRVNSLEKDLMEEQNKNREMSQSLSQHQDNMLITTAFKKDLDLVPSMKKEVETLQFDNQVLRKNEQNNLLLEEEVRTLKQKLETALLKVENFTELEVLNEELQGRLQRWEVSDTSGSRRPQSPSSLTRRVNDLELSQAELLLKQGETESSLKIENRKLTQALREKQELSLNLSSQRETIGQQSDLIKRLKRKVLFLSKERDGLKSVIDLYDNEATINVDAATQRRIEELQGVVYGYQEQTQETDVYLTQLEDKLASTQEALDKAQQQLLVTSASRQSTAQDTDTVQQLREQVAMLENTLMSVTEERDVLLARIEQRNLQGEYDPSKTKVIHLLNNPCSQAEAEHKQALAKLTLENDGLRARNHILESEGRVEDLTVQVGERLQHPSPSKELEAMRQELKLQETRNQRLMAVYKKTSHEFRDICYQLTGFKIDITCTNQYRLTNIYSPSASDFLYFQQNEDGDIQMLETDFSKSLSHLTENYLCKRNSIPVFLSQVTLDLYAKQTLILD